MDEISELALSAFKIVHEGRSVDDVVIDDNLNQRFLDQCRSQMVGVSDEVLNWKLLNLRKTGVLGGVTKTRIRMDHSEYVHAAEIAARTIEDRLATTIDRIFCSIENRRLFDEIATSIVNDISPYQLRKAALGLRKKRKLKPELIKRMADWGTKIQSHEAKVLYSDKSLIPMNPGIYIFRDDSGYLYVGEAIRLRQRVWKHLDHSDRKALCRYLFDQGIERITVDLHVFDEKSNGRLVKYRRAYESNLIASRSPKFNQRP